MFSPFAPAPPMLLTPPIVALPTPGTMAHSVNSADTAFTRCHRRTSGMLPLDSSLVASLVASGEKRLACRVCHLEGQKAREQARQVPPPREVEAAVGYALDMAKTPDPLTPRQREITDMFLAGSTYKEVAAQFGISPETVNPTLKAVRAKVGASGISREALKAALDSRG